MPVKGTTYLTVADKLKQTVDGKVTGEIIEMLAETNDILLDAEVTECNNGDTHKTVVRSDMPEAEFREFYKGVNPSKSGYTQVQDSTGMLETYSEVDKSLADLNADKAQFLMNEAQSFLESMNITCQENLIYGSKDTNPAGFDGFAKRYNSINTTDKKSKGYRVISAGGSGSDNTSIYFVTWGKQHATMIYPKGSQAGIVRENKDQQTKVLADGTMYEVYREHYKWDLGLSIRDHRSSGRICNIDVSDLTGASAADLIPLMVKLHNRIKRFAKTGRTVIYVNETILTALELQAMEKTNVHLSIRESQDGGQPFLTFRGVPVRCIDQILDTEAAVA